MPIILYDASWMIYNLFLAYLAVVFGLFFITIKGKFPKTVFGIAWLLFLPNTIYIFTDLVHLMEQWNLLKPPFFYVLLGEYSTLLFAGLFSYLVAFQPFEKILKEVKVPKKRKVPIIIVFNFLIAFGMVLGRVERINSWEVITHPLKVLDSAVHVLISFDLLGLTLLFGLVCNFFYFLFRDSFLHSVRQYLELLD